ncbi:NAD(P)-dependent alcohol dehydrogenase [Haloarcula japonica]|uniref:Zinc-binding dehydrogenase n=1 Tax=Haloarcula japonica (strain ATCC 49778 / DSM 6131 / JCM 7785 / NBRC 101032 / NCIMB 13157 / TR-1) TaxID=1227453 RepID=M0L266_HALJT|nr:NAD(P)-dependent alcohol dehydrogenase [Haloarcula japonica]EMA27646.1 zinc-binding dehydrogenase [Haloarcula japonica DSM 6131]
MRTCVLSDVGELSVVEREQPSLDPDEVLVRISRVGICGSDLHYYQHGENSGNVVDFPHVLGHESSGTVVEVGSDVSTISVSDRVAIEPGIPCGDCSYCNGDSTYHLCEQMEYLSSPPVDGALTEYVAWPADLVYTLPEGVSLREGALAEPLSVAIHACDRGDVSDGDTVLVTGGGPIGQLVSEVALDRGAEVILTDVVPEKLELAEQRGVQHTIDVSSADPVAAIEEYVDGPGVDIVLESSGANSAIELTTETVKRGGSIVFVGIPIDADLPTDVVGLITDEYDLHGSFRFSNTYPEAIEGIRAGRYDVDSIVSFEQSLAETQAAFDRAIEPESVKGVVRISDESE